LPVPCLFSSFIGSKEMLASIDVSEPAFAGGFDRANLAVDALNRVTASWVSKPDG
jgi:hypothetical protein